MLSTRILAALVFAPALLALVAVGGEPLRLGCAAIGAAMLYEALNMALPAGPRRLQLAGWACGAVALAHGLDVLPAAIAPQASCIVLMLLVALGAPGRPAEVVAQAALALGAALYAGGLIPLLWRLRSVPQLGLTLALMALFCTWAADTGAYFAGRSFGRRPLYPRLSPKKTLEGALGGVVLAMAMAAALRGALAPSMALGTALTLGIVAATLGTLGDLAESLLKRASGVKDSSALIPGHGGVLDRFDGVLFALWGIDVWLRWRTGL